MGCCLAHSDSVDIGLHLKRSSLEQKEGMADLLPEDVLANIIRRLAPRHLAISRCVCKAWCTIIDGHNLLRVDLLPHSVCGLFINFNELSMSEFFSRPSKGPAISGYHCQMANTK
ncbi:hypothetical protein U9M48_027057 [Paspalum notatum var. saurae]|uniref:F-box domain-containing protein n=1 Tax=Paspalum notatum var. saurae TaxID=547442 RepID=A0AAQ3WYZ6_PASNO